MSHVLRSNLFRWIVVLVACATLSMAAFAQSTVTGAVAGTVVDPSKAVVVGAKVTVHNIETNFQASFTTDTQGKFRASNLQPGIYEVVAETANFAPSKAEKVIVEVGRVTELELAMNVAGKQEVVEVTGEAPMVNTLQQDFSHNLSQDAIQNLPINGRRWSMFALLTPGATPDGGFGLISFRGISGLLNNNTVDGGDNNQAFFSEERGRTRASYTVSQSSIREFQVNTSNYSSEYGRAAGGVVNSVTKSGTNNIHGEGFWYIRDNELGATNPFTRLTVNNGDGTFSSVPYKPEDRRQQFGGNIGGPLIKDKLFFFFNYDGQRRNFPGNAVVSSMNIFGRMTMPYDLKADGVTKLGTSSEAYNIINRFSIGKTGTNACTPWPACTYSSLTGGSNWYTDQAQAIMNSGLNFIQAETGTVPRAGTQDIFFPKLDWRITQKHTFTISYNRMRWNSPAGVQTQPTNTYGVASFGDDYVKTDMMNARLTSTLTNSLTNEFRYQWGRDFEFQNSQPPSAAELNPCAAMGITVTGTCKSMALSSDSRVAGFNISGALTLGRPNFLERNAYPNETRNQVADTMNLVHGKHLIKFGFDFNRNNDYYNSLYEAGGYYSYSGSNARVNFVTDLYNYVAGDPTKATQFSSYYQGFGPTSITFHTWDYAGFIQDDFRVLPRLTLSFGVRYEYEKIPDPMYPNWNATVPLYGTTYWPTTQMPSDKNNFGPRFGFAYDVFGNGKTSLRGGYGMYYGRINNGVIGNVMFNTGAPGTQQAYNLSWSSTGTAGVTYPLFPNLINALPSNASVKPAMSFFDPHMQVPQIHQADLILEHEVAKNTVVSLSYMMSLGRQLPQFIDTNIAQTSLASACPAPLMFDATTGICTIKYVMAGGPFDGQNVSMPFYTRRLNTNFGTMMDVSSSVNSNYNAFVAQFNRRMTNGLQFQMNYTWAHAIDDGQNSLTQTPTYMNVTDPYNLGLERGTSNFDVRHRFVATAVYQPQYFKKSGVLTKAMLNGWSLAPVVTISSGKPYTDSVSGSPYLTYNSTSYTSGANSGLNGAGGNYRLATLLGRNSFRYPNFANIDMRLSRSFHITERQAVEFVAEAFNLFNSEQITGINNTMFVAAAPTSLGGLPVLNFTDAAHSPTYSPFGSFNQAGTNLYRERQVQFAIKYSF